MKKRRKRLNTVYSDSFKKNGERPFDRTYSNFNREFSLPEKYGRNEIVLMVADPLTIYAYWEIEEEVFNEIRKENTNKKIKGLKRILRVYEIRETFTGKIFENRIDVKFGSFLGSQYICLPVSGKKWTVDAGLVSETGRFFPAIRSNEVKTPLFGIAANAAGSISFSSGGA
ncbi:MAG: DUF4912 domain-containing protein [Candidatus Omnitrophica bacterium]|nr:DUF4912 domain-containing protein [Candidatus Omnitrophota bacterium]